MLLQCSFLPPSQTDSTVKRQRICSHGKLWWTLWDPLLCRAKVGLMFSDQLTLQQFTTTSLLLYPKSLHVFFFTNLWFVVFFPHTLCISVSSDICLIVRADGEKDWGSYNITTSFLFEIISNPADVYNHKKLINNVYNSCKLCLLHFCLYNLYNSITKYDYWTNYYTIGQHGAKKEWLLQCSAVKTQCSLISLQHQQVPFRRWKLKPPLLLRWV